MKVVLLSFLVIISAFFMALRPSETLFPTNNSRYSASMVNTDGEIRFHKAAPVEVLFSSKESSLLVVSEEPARIIRVNPADQSVQNIVELSRTPTGAVLAKNSGMLYVTLGGPDGQIAVVDMSAGNRIVRHISTDGHTPIAPVLSPDEQVLYVCNRYHHEVIAIDLKKNRIAKRYKVLREPSTLALTSDGNHLIVGNFLPNGPSNAKRVNSEVSMIDLRQDIVENIALPNGSNAVGGIALSPDGKYAYLTHVMGRFQVPTTHVERGWINTNALSIIHLEKKELYACVLLDDVELGFSNPWAVNISPDGKMLLVSSFGGNELSVIDRSELHKNIESSDVAFLQSDLALMHRINRQRIKLPGYGPSSILTDGKQIYISEYFSGTLTTLSLDNILSAEPMHIALADRDEQWDEVRYGRMLFNSSDLCFQKWQSCASCHPNERIDGLNWDNLNDGVGNPKNTRSLLLAHEISPVMALGVRESAEYAVRAGLRFIQFVEAEEEKAVALDTYIKAMRPEPSPYLVKNKLSKSALRGQKLFEREGCNDCHPAPLYTDMKGYVVPYVGSQRDKGKEFNTPRLVEVWRTAPYMHDGSLNTMEEVVRLHNPYSKTKLSDAEIADLAEYVLSL